jgi:N-acetylmuramoyl-L-alanine amidase
LEKLRKYVAKFDASTIYVLKEKLGGIFMAKVFLDAGHGGKDPGALGSGLMEKNINLAVTLKVGEILTNHGVVVAYSRTTDTFLELSERASLANQFEADVFVSLHCNAFGDPAAKGVETYSYINSTNGAKLAKSIQDSIISSGVYTRDRGTKTANFAVLRLTKMPAALVEMGFITNKDDAFILINRQQELALAIAKGILSYLGIAYQEKTTTLYRVQVGAFRIKNNADNIANELRQKGYETYIYIEDGLYKVQVGAFRIRANAEKLVEELKSQGYEAIIKVV